MRDTSAALMLLVSFGVVTTAPGCTAPPDAVSRDQPAQAPPIQYETDAVTLVLPRGDRQAGRQAFVDLKCAVCHRVVGETTLPAPVSDTPGPDLDRTLAVRPISEVAAAIVVPSHSMSVRTSDDVKKKLEGTLSPMGDVSRVITVGQRADLIAYLRSLGGPNGGSSG